MIPFKSKLEKYKTIKGRNVGFNNLSDEQKRKEIAYDALNLLTKKVVQAVSGAYWLGDGLEDKLDKRKTPEEFQESLCSLKRTEDCECCARGILMLSQIRLGNSISPKEGELVSGSHSIVKGFDMNSFVEMESIFENYEDEIYIDAVNMDVGSNKLLANILCNVIANGNFTQEDTTNYVKKWRLSIKD